MVDSNKSAFEHLFVVHINDVGAGAENATVGEGITASEVNVPVVAAVAQVGPANPIAADLCALSNLGGRKSILPGDRKFYLNRGRRFDEFAYSFEAQKFSVIEEFLSLLTDLLFLGAHAFGGLFKN